LATSPFAAIRSAPTIIQSILPLCISIAAAESAINVAGILSAARDNGSQIEIEQRAASEFLPDCYVQEDGLINAWNPVFDVTPAELISVIVTEYSILENNIKFTAMGINTYFLNFLCPSKGAPCAKL
jgi:hypothetical protein